MKIYFYYADEKYIEYLKNKEFQSRGFACVPNVEYSNREKFLYGAVLNINSANYYVPVSSKTGKNNQYNLDIKSNEKKNQLKGSLRFPFMIPIPSECLKRLDIISLDEPNERAKISKELAFGRRNKARVKFL